MYEFAIASDEVSADENEYLQKKKIEGCLISEAEFSDIISDGILQESPYSFEETLLDIVQQDESVYFYKFTNGDSECFAYSSMGVDVVFSQDGGFSFHDDVVFNKGTDYLYSVFEADAAVMPLMPCNSPSAKGKCGIEKVRFDWGSVACFEGEGGALRIVKYSDSIPTAGIIIKDDVVDSIYVPPESRNQGLATQIFGYAKILAPKLEHSSVRTADGAGFIKSLSETSKQQELPDYIIDSSNTISVFEAENRCGVNEIHTSPHNEKLSPDDFFCICEQMQISEEVAVSFGDHGIDPIDDGVEFYASRFLGESCVYAKKDGISHLFLSEQSLQSVLDDLCDMSLNRSTVRARLSCEFYEQNEDLDGNNSQDVTDAVVDFYNENKEIMDQYKISPSSISGNLRCYSFRSLDDFCLKNSRMVRNPSGEDWGREP